MPMKRYKCQYPGCKKPEEFRATNDSAEWAHVCAEHQPYTYYPDAWEPIPSVIAEIIQASGNRDA